MNSIKESLFWLQNIGNCFSGKEFWSNFESPYVLSATSITKLNRVEVYLVSIQYINHFSYL